MPDLVPIPLSTLLERAYYERSTTGSIYDLPLKEMYRGSPGVDLSVRFHDLWAGTPLGPAAGPHDQMAQNIVLAWLAGSRIIELKTVQVLDELVINRPCIDATNVGFNIEWSQELKLQQSLREYVKAAMIVDVLREENALGVSDVAALPPHFFDTVYDMSVGYDLKGIASETVTAFIRQMIDARTVVDELRPQIPDELARYRDYPFRTNLVKTATLSTFHGCPKDEIERICRYLIEDMGLHTIIKLNPVQIGKAKLEELLHDRLGYTHLEVNERAYEAGLTFDEAVELVQRLEPVARARGVNVGVKFSNTLEVHNTLRHLPDELMYLSGQPLHVIAMTLVEQWREAVGTRYPVSFAAGIDRRNFANAVACGLVPVTVCTDLLRTRGYGRMPGYLADLASSMAKAGATTIDGYVMNARPGEAAGIESAVMRNTRAIAAETRSDPRYAWPQNQKSPNKIDSQLWGFDCISCDKCLPVCPNDANFVIEAAPVQFAYRDYVLSRGRLLPGESHVFALTQDHQIANFADACNECGNCDTFCPEYGAPFIAKPAFFGSEASWKGRPLRDGFYVQRSDGTDRIKGRIDGHEYTLELNRARGEVKFDDGAVEVTLRASSGELVGWKAHEPSLAEPDPSHAPSRRVADHVVRMGHAHAMRALLEGVLDPRRVNYVNAAFVRPPAVTPG